MHKHDTQGEVTLREVASIRDKVVDAIRETQEAGGNLAVLDAIIRKKLSSLGCTWRTSYVREQEVWCGELCVYRDTGVAKVDMYHPDHNVVYAMLGGYIFTEKSLLNYFYGRDDMASARKFIDVAITCDALAYAAVNELSPRDNHGMSLICGAMYIASACALVLGGVVLSKLF